MDIFGAIFYPPQRVLTSPSPLISCHLCSRSPGTVAQVAPCTRHEIEATGPGCAEVGSLLQGSSQDPLPVTKEHVHVSPHSCHCPRSDTVPAPRGPAFLASVDLPCPQSTWAVRVRGCCSTAEVTTPAQAVTCSETAVSMTPAQHRAAKLAAGTLLSVRPSPSPCHSPPPQPGEGDLRFPGTGWRIRFSKTPHPAVQTGDQAPRLNPHLSPTAHVPQVQGQGPRCALYQHLSPRTRGLSHWAGDPGGQWNPSPCEVQRWGAAPRVGPGVSGSQPGLGCFSAERWLTGPGGVAHHHHPPWIFFAVLFLLR